MADKKADLAGPGIGNYEDLEKILPDDYQALLPPKKMMKAVYEVKNYIEENLCKELNLQMVQVPLIVDRDSGMNDMLDRDGSMHNPSVLGFQYYTIFGLIVPMISSLREGPGGPTPHTGGRERRHWADRPTPPDRSAEPFGKLRTGSPRSLRRRPDRDIALREWTRCGKIIASKTPGSQVQLAAKCCQRGG